MHKEENKKTFKKKNLKKEKLDSYLQASVGLLPIANL